MIIRKASLIDAEGIAKVHVDSWRTTYENIIPKDYLDNLSYNQRTDLWKNNIGNKGILSSLQKVMKGRSLDLLMHGKEKIIMKKILLILHLFICLKLIKVKD